MMKNCTIRRSKSSFSDRDSLDDVAHTKGGIDYHSSVLLKVNDQDN